MDKGDSAIRKSLPVAALVIAVITGVALRFADLGGQSLWTDEIITIKTSFMGDPFPANEFFSLLEGPLISLMIHFWGRISMGEAFLRLPFALAGTLTVLWLFVLARSIADRWTALNTAFVVSLSPMLIWYSQEVRGYAFVLLFTVLATYYLMRFVRTGRSLYLIPYGVFLLAGCLSNFTGAFVAGAHLVYLLIYHRRPGSLGKWAVAIFVVLLFLLPWIHQIYLRIPLDRLVAGDTGEPLVTGARFSPMAIPYSLFTYSVGYSLGPPVRELQTNMANAVRENLHWALLASVLFAVPVLVGMRDLARKNSELLVFLLIWILVPIAALSVLNLRNVRIFTPRYAMVAVPAYAMIVGRGLAVINKSKWWPFTVAFTFLLAISLYNYFGEPRYRKDDARGVARTITENLREGDSVVAHFAAAPLAHYLNDSIDVQIFEADDMESRETMIERCRQISADSGRVWLSLCRDWILDPEGNIHGWFDRNMVLEESFEFPGMRLYLYRRLPGESGQPAEHDQLRMIFCDNSPSSSQGGEGTGVGSGWTMINAARRATP